MKSYENRHNGLDLLRVLSAVSVILIHINARYLSGNIQYMELPYFLELLIDSASRFSVPCFVMMSGAFLLENKKNQCMSYFYRISVFKIYGPFLAVVCLLLIQSEVKQIFTSHNYGEPLQDIFRGTFYNLWFMYMLLFLYLMVPFVVRLKETCSEKQFKALGIVLLIWGAVSQTAIGDMIAYSNGLCFSFLGYFITGNAVFNQRMADRKIMRGGVSRMLMAAGLLIITVLCRYSGTVSWFFSSYSVYFFPPVILYAVLIFEFFSDIHIRVSVKRISALTFYVYLFHSVIYGFLFKILDTRLIFGDIINIAVVFVLTVLLSFTAAECFAAVWKKSIEKMKLYDRWCELPVWKMLDENMEQNG